LRKASNYDVAIVGYGPVGAIFANLLANYGLKIAVIERASAIYDKPRAITLDHEALRVFQSVALADFMENAIAPHNGSHYLGVDGKVIKMFDPMPPPYPLGWTPNVTFVQPDAEQALRDKLAGRGCVSLDHRRSSGAGRSIGIAEGEGGNRPRIRDQCALSGRMRRCQQFRS
jgi:2-polyprenyl-6-methoxyphenol hydroxylase-like FAD-dependent oxidoreductase